MPALQPKPDRLIVVTGWGKSRRATRVGDLRGRVAGALAAMGATHAAERQPGEAGRGHAGVDRTAIGSIG